MPPRGEEELDAVTLHNQALMNMDSGATAGFRKFQFLLQQDPFPAETFGNLLLLYIKYEVGENAVLGVILIWWYFSYYTYFDLFKLQYTCMIVFDYTFLRK